MNKGLVGFSKLLVFAVLCLDLSMNALSIPSINKTFTITQTDGSKITLRLKGDEYCHYYSTLDNVPVFENNGSFYYGYLENGEIKISDIIAHEKENRSNEESAILLRQPEVTEYFKNIRSPKITSANEMRLMKRTKRKTLGETGDYVGCKKGLVILVNFTDLSFQSESAAIDFNNMFNREGYNKNGCIGSVRDYFLDQSYGKFDLSFDVIGPVELSNPYSYYGANSIETGSDRAPYEMVIEACNLVDGQVDYKDYDWDGDGEVDQVFIIYAGYGENAGASSNTIWPHESQLYTRKIILDGVYINTYACSCELSGNSGHKMNGIGTSCHEFSHCLGFPDLYDTDYSGAFGMSYWDVMNSGSYNGPDGIGEVPYGYSAYERWYAGWLEPIEIEETQEQLELRNLEQYPDAYIIYNEGNRNEYYILENHQSEKWFRYVNRDQNMHGLMITHVDYDKDAWLNNIVNPNKKHQRLSIIPADNMYGETEQDLRGDLFPGTNNVITLTKNSHAETGGKLFNKNIDGTYYMNMSIARIKEENGVILFDVVDTKDFPIPQVRPATQISNDGYIANWDAIPEADYYVLEKCATYLWNSTIPITKEEATEIYDSTYCKMTWFFDNCNEKYRISAIIKGIPTEWSEYQPVALSNSVDQIGNVANDEATEYYGIDGIKKYRNMTGFTIIVRGNKTKKMVIHK